LQAQHSAFGGRETAGRNPQNASFFATIEDPAKVRPVRCLLSAVIAIALAGCQAQSPSLLEITDLAPRELELGDRLELVGSGFPEGRPARITFRGDLFKPGQPPERDVTISLMAESASPHSIALVVNEELEAKFCGELPPAHATFRGEVSAAFSPRVSGAPPIAGVLEGVVLDVQPSALPAPVLEARAREAERFATFLGVKLEETEARREPVIVAVDPKGRAAEAGLLPGDAFVEIDGVRVQGDGDLIPPPRTRTTRVSVRRGSSPVALKFNIDVAEFSPAALTDLAPAATLIGIAVSALLLFLSPLGRWLTWFERRLVHRLKDERLREPSGALAFGRRVRRGFGRVLSQSLPLTPFPYLVLIGASAALTWLALGHAVVAKELDFPVLFLGAASSLVATGLIGGGYRRGNGFSLAAGMRRGLLIAGHHVPLLGGMVCAILGQNALRPDDIVHAQGPSPWNWYAFASPVSFAAFALCMAALVPEASAAEDRLSDVLAARPRFEKGSRERLAGSVAWGHLLLMCGLLAALFLGGWAGPRLFAESSLLGAGLAVAVFQLKILALLVAIVTVRWALCHVSVEQAKGVLFRCWLPLTPCLIGATLLWTLGAKLPLVASARGALSAALIFMCVFGLLYLVERVVREMRRPGAQASVNPWL
jgi:NADH-quinone oxidoreductase subunit H